MKINKVNEMDTSYPNPNDKNLIEKYGIDIIYYLDVTNLPVEIEDELESFEIYTHDEKHILLIDGSYPVFFKFLKEIELKPNEGNSYRILVTG
jgi:hypothetical protein